MRYLYSLIFYLILPFIFLRLKLKARKLASYEEHWHERLGYAPISNRPLIWLHAVSVGETIASAPLVKAIKHELPEYDILVTNMTPTGRLQAEQSLGDDVIHAFVPYDYTTAVKRFLRRVKPQLLIIMETELWPNIIHYTTKAKIPIILANARLSKKSANAYQWIRFFVKAMLKNIDKIAVQSQADAERFLNLGANEKQIEVTGNIKFDCETPDNLIKEGKLLRSSWNNDRPVWIAASTHEGEEEKILKAHQLVKQTLQDALLILVPRHPERFQTVYELCLANNFSVIKRSDDTPCLPNTDVFLGDSMGELFLYYGMSDAAFVGGSLVQVGGHNVLEPAAIGIPVITGNIYHNFIEIVSLLEQAGTLAVINDENMLNKQLIKLLTNKPLRLQIGQLGREVVMENRGALKKHLSICLSYLKMH